MSRRVGGHVKSSSFNVILIYRSHVKTPPGHGSLLSAPSKLCGLLNCGASAHEAWAGFRSTFTGFGCPRVQKVSPWDHGLKTLHRGKKRKILKRTSVAMVLLGGAVTFALCLNIECLKYCDKRACHWSGIHTFLYALVDKFNLIN